jgi:hypothetical protein
MTSAASILIKVAERFLERWSGPRFERTGGIA